MEADWNLGQRIVTPGDARLGTRWLCWCSIRCFAGFSEWKIFIQKFNIQKSTYFSLYIQKLSSASGLPTPARLLDSVDSFT